MSDVRGNSTKKREGLVNKITTQYKDCIYLPNLSVLNHLLNPDKILSVVHLSLFCVHHFPVEFPVPASNKSFNVFLQNLMALEGQIQPKNASES